MTEPDPAADPELLAWIVLRRVVHGGVVRVGRCYLDHARPVPGYLLETLHELISAGFLAVADPDPIAEASRRVTATAAGLARYAVLQRREALRAGRSPICRRLITLVALSAAQPDLVRVPGRSGAPDLRWGRCATDRFLHVVDPADGGLAAGREHVEALCGSALATEDLLTETGQSGRLCLACLVAIAANLPAVTRSASPFHQDPRAARNYGGST